MTQYQYDDILNNPNLTKEQKVKAIKERGEQNSRDIMQSYAKDIARMAAGSVLSGASFLPIFNIPYVGTGIGGAMYDAGQAIVEGDKLGDIAKRAGRGFAIGETIGAVPYVGKAASKTKAGQALANSAPVKAVSNALDNAAEKFAQTKAYDTLMSEFAPKQALDRQIVPIVRKVKAGGNPFERAYSEVLADTPITETEAFKVWSGNKPLVTSEQALEYPFKTGEGVTLEGFHGTKRGDRVGSEFRKDRATSGPMAFFSSNKDIAKGYAEGKADTSLINDAWDYGNWYQYKDKNGKLKPLSDAWFDLTPEERLAISKNAPHITLDENAENIIFNPNVNYGTGNYNYAIRSNKNNHLKALINEWLESGNLYGDEDKFYKVLEKSGINMDNINYIDPHADYSKVYDVFLSMKKPLVTNDIPGELVEQLVKEAPNHPASGMGVDMWDKNVQDGNVWISRLKNDLSEGKSSHAWTSIPDWVINELKNAGYDGIIDVGGKGGGQIHKVYIPFEPTQIKSVNNEGTFDLSNPNIYKAILGGLGASQLLKQQNNNIQ